MDYRRTDEPGRESVMKDAVFIEVSKKDIMKSRKKIPGVTKPELVGAYVLLWDNVTESWEVPSSLDYLSKLWKVSENKARKIRRALIDMNQLEEVKVRDAHGRIKEWKLAMS